MQEDEDDDEIALAKMIGWDNHEAREIISKRVITATERDWLISTFIRYRRSKELQQFVPAAIEEYILDQLEQFLKTHSKVFPVKTGRHLHPFAQELEDSAVVTFAFSPQGRFKNHVECFGSFQVACEIAPAFREPLTRRRLRFRCIPEISGNNTFEDC